MHTQPLEDIDAVIGRFQAWAGSRNAAAEPKPGIRELTYEEALESQRKRWKGAPPVSASRAPVNGLRKEPDAKQVDTPRHAAAKATTPQRSRTQKRRSAKSVPPVKTPLASPAPRPSLAAKHEASPAKKTSAVGRVGAKVPAEPPAFREVLVSTVLPAEVVVATQPAELSRQVAISIRLALSERALLRTRAAEAGITVSAYIRQCALEIEQLRAQVKQTLAALEQQSATPAIAAQSQPDSKPGFLTRLMRRLLPVSTPRLVLRA